MLMREIGKIREERGITEDDTYDGVLSFYSLDECESVIKWLYDYHKRLQNSKEALQYWRTAQT